MNKLEETIRDNKAYFNQLEPSDKSWANIRTELKKNGTIKPKTTSIKWRSALSIAASLILLFGSYLMINQRSSTNVVNFAKVAMSSPEGKMISLDPTQNKYTLVQFWESGNVLCSEENCYYYLPAYEKYKEKGFEIYAISLDRNKEDWVQGITDNDLPWIHMSDLKGWDSPICIECNITKVPTSFLLDQDGNIIEEDLKAEELDHTLDKLFAGAE